MDFMGPLSETPDGNVYILHVIDYFSRMSYAWPTKVAMEQVVIRCLSEFFAYYVAPVAVYTDRGTHFGCTVSKWLKDQGVDPIRSSSYSPSSTGMIEKRNHLLAERIRRMALADGVGIISKIQPCHHCGLFVFQILYFKAMECSR